MAFCHLLRAIRDSVLLSIRVHRCYFLPCVNRPWDPVGRVALRRWGLGFAVRGSVMFWSVRGARMMS